MLRDVWTQCSEMCEHIFLNFILDKKNVKFGHVITL